MKCFGLRVGRLQEWAAVVRLSRPGWRDWRKMVAGLLGAAWRARVRPEESPGGAVAKERLRVCVECPMRRGGRVGFPVLREAGVWEPVEGGGREPMRCGGCGCYVPYVVATVERGGGCWARRNPEVAREYGAIGWE